MGVGINRSNYAQGIFGAYATRVVADGGVVEGGSCVDAVSSLLQSASLLLIPSGYKGGKLYAEIPTNGNGDLTWTRGSDAFRTNASGLIQRVPWNLLQRSEEFDNAVWTKFNATISSNVTTAPNGTLTAEKFIPTTTNAPSHSITQSVTPATPITFSCYAKSAEYSKLMIFVVGTNKGYGFDLDTGTSFSVTGINNAVASQSITNVGNGWYRCSITISETTVSRCDLYVLNSTSYGPNFSGNGTDGLYIWGAQLVEGTTAQTYLPTTDRLNFPRLDYTYGSCPSALLEPQRTNLALQSQAFDVSPWSAISATITANTTISPDGIQNADTITTPSPSHNVRQSITVTANTTYTFSFYALRGTMTDLKYSVFDVSGGANIIAPTSYYSQTNSSSWSRISVTFTTPVGCTSIFVYPIRDSGAIGTLFVWGAQLEAGAYPTTYIPTTGSATATRVADSAVKTGISSLIGQTEGTLFVSAIPNLDTLFIPNVIIRTSFTDFIAVGFIDNKVSLRKRISGGGILTLYTSTTVYTTGSIVKIALKYTSTSYNLFINGTSVSSSSTSMPSSFDTISLNGDGSFFSIGRVFNQQIALYTTALSDTDCTTLTTL